MICQPGMSGNRKCAARESEGMTTGAPRKRDVSPSRDTFTGGGSLAADGLLAGNGRRAAGRR